MPDLFQRWPCAGGPGDPPRMASAENDQACGAGLATFAVFLCWACFPVRRGLPCEAWRPMTTPTTRPAAGRRAGRARGKGKRSGGLAPEGRRGRAKRARDPQAVGVKFFGLSVYLYIRAFPLEFRRFVGDDFSDSRGNKNVPRWGIKVPPFTCSLAFLVV